MAMLVEAVLPRHTTSPWGRESERLCISLVSDILEYALDDLRRVSMSVAAGQHSVAIQDLASALIHWREGRIVHGHT